MRLHGPVRTAGVPSLPAPDFATGHPPTDNARRIHIHPHDGRGPGDAVRAAGRTPDRPIRPGSGDGDLGVRSCSPIGVTRSNAPERLRRLAFFGITSYAIRAGG